MLKDWLFSETVLRGLDKKMILLQQMTILFLIMMVGYICRKRKIITEAGVATVSAIVVNVANPALTLSANMNKESSIKGRELLLTFAIAIVMYVAFIILAEFVVRILKIEKSKVGIYKAMTIFSNIGFMGYPVITAMYGSEALLYAAIFNIIYSILMYTYGIHIMTKDEDESADKKDMSVSQRIVRIFNIGVLACIGTLILFFTKLQVPMVIESTVTYLSNLTAPLSMIVIGSTMTNMKFRDMFGDVKLLLFSVIKLIIIPVIGMTAAKFVNLNPMLLGVCLVMFSTPVGSMTVMIAQQFGGDYETASKGVALTTILSVITMPIMAVLLL